MIRIWSVELAGLREENNTLKNENLRLKNENNDLSERINNLTYILADLQGKTKNAEEERDSVITAMRLLVAESNTAIEKSQSPKYNPEIEQLSGPNGADECTTQEQMKDILIPNIQISNRFSALDTDQNYAEDSKTASQRTRLSG